jgi:hypothetical protein
MSARHRHGGRCVISIVAASAIATFSLTSPAHAVLGDHFAERMIEFVLGGLLILSASILLEAEVIGAEALAYCRFLGLKDGAAAGISILSNVASLAAGFWLSAAYSRMLEHLHPLLLLVLLGGVCLAVEVPIVVLALARHPDRGRVARVAAGANMVTYTVVAIFSYGLRMIWDGDFATGGLVAIGCLIVGTVGLAAFVLHGHRTKQPTPALTATELKGEPTSTEIKGDWEHRFFHNPHPTAGEPRVQRQIRHLGCGGAVSLKVCNTHRAAHCERCGQDWNDTFDGAGWVRTEAEKVA